MEPLIIIQQRKVFNEKNCISERFINGVFFCYVLEDIVRADGEKVDGKTAIPADTYSVKLTMSNRFKRMLPLIYNKPDLTIDSHGVTFAGVRDHGGNTEEDTDGCNLVAHNTDGIKVWGSAEKDMVALIEKHGGQATLIIENKGVTGGGLNKILAT